jgi:alkylation response protein AidB-like acyl-CoA dehydrogenase
MDLELSPSEIAFRDELAAWLRDNLPDEARMSKLRGLPEERSYAIRREWDRKLGASGWLGVSWPKEFGGRGATAMEQAIYLEELLRADAPEPLDQLGLPLVGPTVIDIGTDDQKHTYLPPMMRADVLWCQGFSEPNAGSDLAGLQTRADRDSDEWVVNGQKIWSSQAHYSQWCALLARTDPDAPKHKGISFFLVDMSTPGLTVRSIKQISGDADFCELFFDNVRVPHENLLGELNGGWAVANRLLAYERGVITMEMLLGYQRQWNEMKEFASTTNRSGGALIDDPRVRERLASCWMDIQLMRLANLRYITRYMRGSPPGAETSYMKLFWANTEQGLSDLAMKLGGPETLIMPGGEGGVHGGEWTRAYFMSRAASIYGGTYDIQRNIIAERVFGLPR